MTDIDVSDEILTFRCRKCRFRLFSADQLESHELVDQSPKMDFGDGSFHVANLASYEKCSSWFLKHESMLPWIAESVEEVC